MQTHTTAKIQAKQTDKLTPRNVKCTEKLSCHSNIKSKHTYMYTHAHTVIHPAVGASLSPQLSYPAPCHTHTLPSPPRVPRPPCVMCLGTVDGTTKGGRMQMSTNTANWYTTDRLKSKCLTFYLLHWHTVIAYKCPRHPHQRTLKHTVLPSVSIPAAGLLSGVCWRRLPYFLGLFLISPRAFKIWPGQMGKGVWPTLMDSTPIKRMSELSKARGPCVRVCLGVYMCVLLCVCEQGWEGIKDCLFVFQWCVCVTVKPVLHR